MSSRHSRREFMGLAAIGAAGVFTRPRFEGNPRLAELFRGSALAPDADLVVFNAKVYTMDAAMPRAEAFAVNGGRFIAVGSSADDSRARSARERETFDAKQMTIVPGFTDCHNHAGGTTLLYEVLVGNPFEVEFVTIDEHHRQAARQGAADAAGHVGRRLFLRRHEGQGQAAAQSRTISTRCRPSIRSSCSTAADTRRSTTPRRSSWRESRRTRRIRRAARSTATRAVS